MNSLNLSIIAGAQGTGRSTWLKRELARLQVASKLPNMPAVVIVDPMSAWVEADLNEIGSQVTVVRGQLAKSSDVFDILVVMAGVSRGLIIGIDDAEHMSQDRRRWSSLSSTVVSTGGRLVVVLPDFGVWSPEGLGVEEKIKGSLRRSRSISTFPGGDNILTLAAALRN